MTKFDRIYFSIVCPLMVSGGFVLGYLEPPFNLMAFIALIGCWMAIWAGLQPWRRLPKPQPNSTTKAEETSEPASIDLRFILSPEQRNAPCRLELILDGDPTISKCYRGTYAQCWDQLNSRAKRVNAKIVNNAFIFEDQGHGYIYRIVPDVG